MFLTLDAAGVDDATRAAAAAARPGAENGGVAALLPVLAGTGSVDGKLRRFKCGRSGLVHFGIVVLRSPYAREVSASSVTLQSTASPTGGRSNLSCSLPSKMSFMVAERICSWLNMKRRVRYAACVVSAVCCSWCVRPLSLPSSSGCSSASVGIASSSWSPSGRSFPSG